ncbi:MAG: hypothetical protein V9G18_15260 [Albidovulum sp.]
MSQDLTALPIGRGQVCRTRGAALALLAFGTMVAPALGGRRCARRHGGQHALRQAGRRRCCWPSWRARTKPSSRSRNTCVMGGAGSAVSEALAAAGIVRPLLQLGLADRFIDHGDQALLLRLEGLDGERHRALGARALRRVARRRGRAAAVVRAGPG